MFILEKKKSRWSETEVWRTKSYYFSLDERRKKKAFIWMGFEMYSLSWPDWKSDGVPRLSVRSV